MPVSIMLDAGHGGRDPGAVYNGRQEKDGQQIFMRHLSRKQQRQMKPVLISSYRSTGIPVLLPISTWAWKA